MLSYKELLIEKTKIRLTDPLRYLALTMILDGASKEAKILQREVEEKDLVRTTRSLISATEATIALLVEKGKNIYSYEKELEEYKKFLGPQMNEEEILRIVRECVDTLSEDQRIKKNMKTILGGLGAVKELNAADPKVVSRLTASLLK